MQLCTVPKWWYIKGGKRYLLKGSKEGYAIQARNEVFASLIHASQNRSYVQYELAQYRFEGRKYIGCQCPTFASPKLEFIPAFDYITKVNPGKYEPYRTVFIDMCKNNGFKEEDIINYLDYMALSDFLISNYDRHSNNFGLMRDPDTLQFKSFAPFFDSGNSMMFYNLVDCSIGESLMERTAGFFNSWRKTIEKITNLKVININSLPTKKVFDTIYPVDELGERLNRVLWHFYETHIDFITQLQEGKSFYSLEQKYKAKRTFITFA